MCDHRNGIFPVFLALSISTYILCSELTNCLLTYYISSYSSSSSPYILISCCFWERQARRERSRNLCVIHLFALLSVPFFTKLYFYSFSHLMTRCRLPTRKQVKSISRYVLIRQRESRNWESLRMQKNYNSIIRIKLSTATGFSFFIFLSYS